MIRDTPPTRSGSLKLKDLYEVESLASRREDLAAELGNVRNGKYGITLHGKYQDQEFLNACKESVASVLEQRITVIDARLLELGVEPPPAIAQETKA